MEYIVELRDSEEFNRCVGKYTSSCIPNVGHTIVFHDKLYKVTGIQWVPEFHRVYLGVTYVG